MQTETIHVELGPIKLSVEKLREECLAVVDLSSISEVARNLSVSRTAVREAIKDWGTDKPLKYLDLRIRILQINMRVVLADVELHFNRTSE